ncbi:hypothetical protein K4G22_14030 [Streptomyces profundus]|nr:hypothetical protein K4G22_14030 [Streptomyces sp. MA3_2.13]
MNANSGAHYAERRSWNPLGAPPVELGATELRVGRRRTPLAELRLVAIADAYLRGAWLGGGGSERPLAELPQGPGVLPVTRASGAAVPVGVRNVAAFAAALGESAVRLAGGREVVWKAAALAERDAVPLWIARRQAQGPHGHPIQVAVDRRLVRADVWTRGAPPVRLRGPLGWINDERGAVDGLDVTVGEQRAALGATFGWRAAKNAVTLRADAGEWRLTRTSRRGSRLTRDGEAVAELTRPAARRSPAGGALLPLAEIRHASADPLDAVAAHLLAVSFGLGDAVGTVRFGSPRPVPRPNDPLLWAAHWYTGLGEHRDDSGPGASGDGWHDGGSGGDGGGSGGGGGDGGGGGGGGGGGD